MDYNDLREKGLAQIQELTGTIWTDYNIHDPGVTILEQLCFALTDLNYRASFSIEDLMAEGGNPTITDTLRPRPMLCSGPVTLEDWRMLLLDIEGVENIWIHLVDTTTPDYIPILYHDSDTGNFTLTANNNTEALSLQGLYYIEYAIDQSYSYQYSLVTQSIRDCFYKNRNLCEDLYQVNRLREYNIQIEAQIEIGEFPDPNAIIAQVYAVIYAYLRPTIRFYTLQEMLDKGYRMDEIMEGPQLEHGFLELDELNGFNLRKSLHISDIIHLVMEIEGVEAVNNLSLFFDDQINVSTPADLPLRADIPDDWMGDFVENKLIVSTRADLPWEADIPDGWIGNLYVPTQGSDKNRVTLWHQNRRIRSSWAQSYELLQEIFRLGRQKKSKKSFTELDHSPPIGRDRQVYLHQSIVHQFPLIYGIGEQGLLSSSSEQRKAQAQQLRAYLSFFDQLLANAFAQLGGLNTLFGLAPKNNTNLTSYFSQSLIGEFSGFDQLVNAEIYQQFLDEGGSSEADNEQRIKRLRQHLLARFAEQSTDFSQSDFATENQQQRTFLNNYPHFSYRRFTGFDYRQGNNQFPNVAGLEQRLNYLLGFPQIRPASLVDLNRNASGAFYMIEHILLRPREADVDQDGPLSFFSSSDNTPITDAEDPYSLQLSFIFPNWIKRFSPRGMNSEWEFITKTIREQTPAHLKIYIHRFNKVQMAVFEAAYQEWLQQFKSS